MISELSKFDQQTRAGILAGLVQDLLPNPGISEAVFPQGASRELYDKLYAHIRRRLRISHNDFSPDAKNRLISFISSELEKSILPSSKIKTLRERTGQKGLLRPDLYEISYGDNFVSLNSSLGITKDRVRAAIANPDFVEHLLPEKYGLDTGLATSLFVQNSTTPETSSLLILAIRHQEKLRVEGAWLIYHSEIETSTVQGPLDLLKAFISRYGMKIRCGDITEKFILYREIHVKMGVSNDLFSVLPLTSGEEVEVDTRFNYSLKRALGGDVIEVSVAFALNATEYARDLLRRGVKITRKLRGV